MWLLMLKNANNLGEMVINWKVLDTLGFIILFLVGQILDPERKVR